MVQVLNVAWIVPSKIFYFFWIDLNVLREVSGLTSAGLSNKCVFWASKILLRFSGSIWQRDVTSYFWSSLLFIILLGKWILEWSSFPFEYNIFPTIRRAFDIDTWDAHRGRFRETVVKHGLVSWFRSEELYLFLFCLDVIIKKIGTNWLAIWCSKN